MGKYCNMGRIKIIFLLFFAIIAAIFIASFITLDNETIVDTVHSNHSKNPNLALLSNYSIDTKSYRYIGNYPDGRRTGWTNNLQGVTNDGNYWYFSQAKTLWKFPVEHDLNTRIKKSDPARDILKKDMPPELKGYNHYGDLDHYNGFIFTAVDGRKVPPRIVVFRISDLGYVDSWILDDLGHAGWCAIDSNRSLLYTSNRTISINDPIYRYKINLDKLVNDKEFALEYRDRFPLYDEHGQPLKMDTMQGGDVSDNGFLYTVNGFCTGSVINTGVMVFDDQTGVRVAKSTNGFGDFNYEYRPGSAFWIFNLGCKQEPEGLTLWDLDTEHAPGIRGQLHVIMIDNFGYGVKLYFKHYTNK